MRVELKCTSDQWHVLADAIDKSRDGSKAIKVDKEALNALMGDHQNLIAEFKQELGGHL